MYLHVALVKPGHTLIPTSLPNPPLFLYNVYLYPTPHPYDAPPPTSLPTLYISSAAPADYLCCLTHGHEHDPKFALMLAGKKNCGVSPCSDCHPEPTTICGAASGRSSYRGIHSLYNLFKKTIAGFKMSYRFILLPLDICDWSCQNIKVNYGKSYTCYLPKTCLIGHERGIIGKQHHDKIAIIYKIAVFCFYSQQNNDVAGQ